MKVAIVIHGNLRTFLMPTRENPSIRICDSFVNNIVLPNNADVFAFTDTNDFYYNDTQYYATDRQIEILNNNAYRLHNKVDFINSDSAKQIINDQLNSLIGSNLKSVHIEPPFDATTDPKFSLLQNANVKGSSPSLLVHQFRKLKLAYEMVKEYEKQNGFSYDLIVKWRFDILNPGGGILNFSNYDYGNTDVYVAGVHSPVIYDWHAFGKPQFMHYCFSIYDYLGNFLNEGRIHLCDKCRIYGNHINCSCNRASEITLAPEYHYFKVYQMNNVRIANSGYNAYPYRYKDTNISTPLVDVMNSLNIDAKVLTYTTGIETSVEEFKKT
jgi:hypothetical protein